MSQPTEQQFEELKKRVQNLEVLTSDWQNWKFITRDSSHKIGVAEGLATTLQSDVLQLKVDLAHVSRQISVVIDQQIEAKHQADETNKKLDLILQLLNK